MTIQPPSVGAQPDAPSGSRTYAMVPRTVLTDDRVSDLAVRVYALLDSRLLGKPGHVKEQTLAEELGRSRRSIERAVAELVRLGYLSRSARSRTKSGGWAVCQTTVVNVAREKAAEPADKSVGRRATNLADNRISKTSRNNKQTKGLDVAPGATTPALTSLSAAARWAHLEPYRVAVNEGAGIEAGEAVKLNRRTAELLEQIAPRMTPEQLRELVAGWPRISWSGEAVYSLPRWIVGVVLPGIAEGQSAPPKPTATVPSLPPTPEELRKMDEERERWEAWQAEQAEAAGEKLDDLLVLADQYGITSDIRGVAACRAALKGVIPA